MILKLVPSKNASDYGNLNTEDDKVAKCFVDRYKPHESLGPPVKITVLPNVEGKEATQAKDDAET